MQQTSLEQLSKEQLIGLVIDLQHQLGELKRMVFGTKSERFVSDSSSPAQLAFGFETEEPPASEVVKEQITYSPGLLSQIIVDKFSDHLPVYRQIGLSR